MKIHSEEYNRGLNLLNKIHGGHAGETIIEKLVEVIYQTALYAGFAYATNAMFIAKEVFSERKM